MGELIGTPEPSTCVEIDGVKYYAPTEVLNLLEAVSLERDELKAQLEGIWEANE